jgi:RNA polymerase sigma factor (sigma-70 family)
LSLERPLLNEDRREDLLALAGELRPDLHRYCARLMGSIIDGEDIVQDTLVRAFVALQDLEEAPPLRPWLFRIAHNRALDLLRGREVRMAEPIDAATDVADPTQPDPLEILMRKEVVKTAVTRFVELPTLQRSVVILKDVLDESLIEIAALLDLTVDAVKGHLARGRAHLREINAHAHLGPGTRLASTAVARYVALFNRRDWDGLRALLADNVKLHQSLHPLRVGRADVGLFFTLYAKIDGVSIAPAWLEGREVIAVFEDRADPKLSYVMWLEWRDGRITFIRDYRYVTADAELTLAPETKPAHTTPIRIRMMSNRCHFAAVARADVTVVIVRCLCAFPNADTSSPC